MVFIVVNFMQRKVTYRNELNSERGEREHDLLLPHATPVVLQGQPRFALPVHFVEQVLLHERDVMFLSE